MAKIYGNEILNGPASAKLSEIKAVIVGSCQKVSPMRTVDTPNGKRSVIDVRLYAQLSDYFVDNGIGREHVNDKNGISWTVSYWGKDAETVAKQPLYVAQRVACLTRNIHVTENVSGGKTYHNVSSTGAGVPIIVGDIPKVDGGASFAIGARPVDDGEPACGKDHAFFYSKPDERQNGIEGAVVGKCVHLGNLHDATIKGEKVKSISIGVDVHMENDDVEELFGKEHADKLVNSRHTVRFEITYWGDWAERISRSMPKLNGTYLFYLLNARPAEKTSEDGKTYHFVAAKCRSFAKFAFDNGRVPDWKPRNEDEAAPSAKNSSSSDSSFAQSDDLSEFVVVDDDESLPF